MKEPTQDDVMHRPEAGRFELTVGRQLCHCDYRLRDGVMLITHTEVPQELEGRGYAALLVAAALDHARAAGLKVRPLCSYVRSYMQRRSETQELLG